MRLAVLAPAPAARDATWRPLLEAFAGRGNDVLVLEPGADARPAPAGCARRAYRPCERPLKWDLGYIGGFDPERQAAVERLLIEPARRAPSRTFVIAGSGYPGAERWPANIERLEDVPAASRPAFYAACRF